MIFRRRKAEEPVVVGRDQHRINREDISPRAAQIIRRLRENGHEAHIVGGAVRDLLLGVRPKDFDIATEAHPSQIRRLFRNSRIIGRRFRLVHVFFHQKGRHPEILEVSTFRTQGESNAVDEDGRIVEDNVYGDAKDDARRRDFTINALFYDPLEENIIDYVDGFADIRRRRLRLIGDPRTRMREDPVRVLRALRHSEKLGLNVERATAGALRPHSPLLENIAPSRLFDELLKVLLSGASVPILRAWRKHAVPVRVFPPLETLGKKPPRPGRLGRSGPPHPGRAERVGLLCRGRDDVARHRDSLEGRNGGGAASADRDGARAGRMAAGRRQRRGGRGAAPHRGAGAGDVLPASALRRAPNHAARKVHRAR